MPLTSASIILAGYNLNLVARMRSVTLIYA